MPVPLPALLCGWEGEEEEGKNEEKDEELMVAAADEKNPKQHPWLISPKSCGEEQGHPVIEVLGFCFFFLAVVALCWC